MKYSAETFFFNPPVESFFIFINISLHRCVAWRREVKFINMLLCGDTNYHVSPREEVCLTVQQLREENLRKGNKVMNYSGEIQGEEKKKRNFVNS